MPSVAGLDAHQPGVDNPEYFQMLPNTPVASSGANCISSDLRISSNTSESHSTSLTSPNGNSISTDSHSSQVLSNNFNENGNNLSPSLKTFTSGDSKEVIPHLPPRSIHSPVSSNSNAYNSHIVSPIENLSPPKIPPRPAALSSSSYLGEYIYAETSNISSSLQRSTSSASNGSNGPTSSRDPQTSSPSSSSLHSPLINLPQSPSGFTGSTPSSITAVHNALYHSLDSSNSSTPPTLPLKGLTLIPPAVGPKSPLQSPSSPNDNSHQNAFKNSQPYFTSKTTSRSLSTTESRISESVKPSYHQSLSSPVQSLSQSRLQSQANSHYQSGSSSSLLSHSQMNTSQTTTISCHSSQLSPLFSSEAPRSPMLFEDKYDLSYCESQTLPRRSKILYPVNGGLSSTMDSGDSGKISSGNDSENLNGSLLNNLSSMSASFHESSLQTFEGSRTNPHGRCSLEDLRSSQLKKQEAVSARLAEEASHEAERQRLEEILQMCAEYQRQYSNSPPPPCDPPHAKLRQSSSPHGDRPQASTLIPSPTSTLTQNRNGSLPRDKRSPPRQQHQQQSPELAWGASGEGDGDSKFRRERSQEQLLCSSIECDPSHSPILPRSSAYPPFPPFPDIPFPHLSGCPLAASDSQSTSVSVYDSVSTSAVPSTAPKSTSVASSASFSLVYNQTSSSKLDDIKAGPQSPYENFHKRRDYASQSEVCYSPRIGPVPVGPISPYENLLGQALSPATSPVQSPDSSLVLSPNCEDNSSVSLSPAILALNKHLAELQLSSSSLPSYFCHEHLLTSKNKTQAHTSQFCDASLLAKDASEPASANTNTRGDRAVSSPEAPPKPPRSPRIERSVLGRRHPPPPPASPHLQSLPARTPPPVPPNKPSRKDTPTVTAFNFSPNCSNTTSVISPATPSTYCQYPSSPVTPSFVPVSLNSSGENTVSSGVFGVHSSGTESSYFTKSLSTSLSKTDDVPSSQAYINYCSESNALAAQMSGHMEHISSKGADDMTTSDQPSASDESSSSHLYMNTKLSEQSRYQNDLTDQQQISGSHSSPNGSLKCQSFAAKEQESRDCSGLSARGMGLSEPQDDLGSSVPPSPSVGTSVSLSTNTFSTSASCTSPGDGANTKIFSTFPPSANTNISFDLGQSLDADSPSGLTSSAGAPFFTTTSGVTSLTSTSGMTSLESVSECEELLRAERNEALQYTTDLKRSVADLARQEEEAYRELEVERALLEAECGDVEREVERLESILLQLNERSRTMELRHSGDRDQDHQDLRACETRVERAERDLETAERQLEAVETDDQRDTDVETDLLEAVKLNHETLDAYKKVYEDMEFSQMEREAQREAEREDLNRLMSKERSRLTQQEDRLAQLRKQVEALNAAVQRETSKIDAHRSELNARLQTVSYSLLLSSDNDAFWSGRQASGSSDSEEEDHDAGDHTRGSRLHLLCDAMSAMTHSVTSLADHKNKDMVVSSGCELRERRASTGEELSPDSRTRRELRDEKTRTLDDKSLVVTSKQASGDERDEEDSWRDGDTLADSWSQPNRARESLDCASNSFMDCEAGAREAEVQQKQEKLSGKFSLENIIEDSRQRNRANIAAAVGGSMSRGLSPRSPEALCGRPGPTGASSRQGLGVLQSDSSRVTSDEVDSNAYQGQPSQLSFSDVVMRDHERGGEDLRPLSESSSFCGAAGDHTPPSFCGASGDHTPTSFGATGDHTPTSFGATGENAPPSVRFRPRSGTRSKQQRPLTRYLPVKSTEPSSLQFNLRQHIESAGHQIELCSNIVLTSTSCRGYLHKLSGSAKNKSPQGGALVSPHQTSKNSGRLFGMKAYNKRWFVFDRDEKALIYYADKSESKAKGFIYFADIEEVYVDHLNAYTVNGSKKSGKNCPAVAFCVKARSRTLSLLAPSPAAMRIWVEVIFTGAEGYHTYDEY
ncbi:mucin-17 [Hyalella azteca]|uniref:Mucin-17 n=1 Tax=Hyalella azteca TaxID=294128 RepID=A0A979FXX2_HYAAZ|nr:mucin-17 [Hyalella azteca]